MGDCGVPSAMDCGRLGGGGCGSSAASEKPMEASSNCTGNWTVVLTPENNTAHVHEQSHHTPHARDLEMWAAQGMLPHSPFLEGEYKLSSQNKYPIID